MSDYYLGDGEQVIADLATQRDGLAAVQAALESKASNADLADKADQVALDALADTVSNKLDPSDIAGKVDVAAFDALSAQVAGKASNGDLGEKADQGALDDLAATVAGKADAVDLADKADAAVVAALAGAVDAKADASALPGKADRALALLPVATGPGDIADRFTSSLAGEIDAGPAIGGTTVVLDRIGAARELAGPATVAPREFWRLSPDRIYLGIWIMQRTVDATDPANNAIRPALQALTKNKAILGSPRFKANVAPTVADGPVTVTATIGFQAADDIDLVVPATTVYSRGFVQLYADDTAKAAVAMIDLIDVTEAVEAKRLMATVNGQLTDAIGVVGGNVMDEQARAITKEKAQAHYLVGADEVPGGQANVIGGINAALVTQAGMAQSLGVAIGFGVQTSPNGRYGVYADSPDATTFDITAIHDGQAVRIASGGVDRPVSIDNEGRVVTVSTDPDTGLVTRGWRAWNVPDGPVYPILPQLSVDVFGDSLSDPGHAAVVNGWVYWFDGFYTGGPVRNNAAGGQTSTQQTLLAGVSPIVLASVTGGVIPADGSAVNCTVPGLPLNETGNPLKSIIVESLANGVPLILQGGDNGAAYTIRRQAAGAAIAVSANYPVYADRQGFDLGAGIVWVGRNNFLAARLAHPDPSPEIVEAVIATLRSDVAAIVATFRSYFRRVLVFGCITSSDGAEDVGTPWGDGIRRYNASVVADYGASSYDILARLASVDALTRAGRTPTTADTVAISHGCIPPQLMNPDLLHLNDYPQPHVAADVKTIFQVNAWGGIAA